MDSVGTLTVWCSRSDRKQELEQLVDTARQEKYEISLKLQVPVFSHWDPPDSYGKGTKRLLDRLLVLRIRIRLVTLIGMRILPFTLVQMRIRILSYKYRLTNLKKCSNRLIFHTFWLFICELTRIWIQILLITLMQIRIRILPFSLMRIHPQHCGVFALSFPTS